MSSILTEEQVTTLMLDRSPTFYLPTFALEKGVLKQLTDNINQSSDPEIVINKFLKSDWPIRKVVCAANKVYHEVFEDGWLIIPANRHHSPLMNKLYDALDCSRRTGSIKLDLQKTEQGFIDQWGDFMTREEAYKVAKLAGQYIDPDRNCSDTILYSEGLY